jgi:hypothetical protein
MYNIIIKNKTKHETGSALLQDAHRVEMVGGKRVDKMHFYYCAYRGRGSDGGHARKG